MDLDCRRCDRRSKCQQVVPGVGPASASIMFVGEVADPEDDLLGRPHSGRAGQLLQVRLLPAAGIDPASCYFTLAVKCAGAAVREQEVQACRGWLWQELQEVKPRVVVTLGAIPTRLLLRLKKSFKMGDVVGRFHAVDYMSALIAPWYSPGWVLQRGKKDVGEAVRFLISIKEKVSV
jgi:uracil-DNA glycosylase family 4